MADLQQIVGTVVRRERQDRRMTMKELAARSSVSEVYLGEIERGKKYPSALVLEQLARALGLEAADLLELVAEALREADHPTVTRAIGFAPGRQGTPRLAVKRLAQALDHEDVTMMAQIGAFFLQRGQDSAGGGPGFLQGERPATAGADGGLQPSTTAAVAMGSGGLPSMQPETVPAHGVSAKPSPVAKVPGVGRRST